MAFYTDSTESHGANTISLQFGGAGVLGFTEEIRAPRIYRIPIFREI